MLVLRRQQYFLKWFSSSSTGIGASQLRANYERAKDQVEQRQTQEWRINPRAVFVNNELNLQKLNIYGFDYDYTLAVYTKNLYELIYNLALNRLVNEMKYPRGLLNVAYNIDFAIRGLHYDIDNCCLLKVDAFNQIQKGTVYRGRKKLSDEKIRELYGGYSLPDKDEKLPQLVDLFSLPWAGLLVTTVEYFDEHLIEFDPVSLYEDVKASIQKVHSSGEMYAVIGNNLEKYIHKNIGLREYLTRIQRAGKELFMITNSPFNFMNKGMTFMLGDEWRSLFKYIVVMAKKPGFFQGNSPFRLYNETTDTLSYEKISKLEPEKIYAGGNIGEFSQKAIFEKSGVLYFGDHIYSDLADPMLKLRWNTAAIVPELAREIRIQDQEYWKKIKWLETLTRLMENHQKYAIMDQESERIIQEWAAERRIIRFSGRT